MQNKGDNAKNAVRNTDRGKKILKGIKKELKRIREGSHAKISKKHIIGCNRMNI